MSHQKKCSFCQILQQIEEVNQNVTLKMVLSTVVHLKAMGINLKWLEPMMNKIYDFQNIYRTLSICGSW